MLYNLNVPLAIADACTSDELKGVADDLFFIFTANRNEQSLIHKALQREVKQTSMCSSHSLTHLLTHCPNTHTHTHHHYSTSGHVVS